MGSFTKGKRKFSNSNLRSLTEEDQLIEKEHSVDQNLEVLQ